MGCSALHLYIFRLFGEDFYICCSMGYAARVGSLAGGGGLLYRMPGSANQGGILHFFSEKFFRALQLICWPGWDISLL